MKQNIDIGIIQWFGGFNRKKNRENNGGVVKYCVDNSEKWLSIYNFTDDTRKLKAEAHPSLTDKGIITYEENGKKYVFLVDEKFCFSRFDEDELILLLRCCMENKTSKEIVSAIVKAVMERRMDLSNVFKDVLFTDEVCIKTLAINLAGLEKIEFIKYFFKQKDYFTLYIIEEIIKLEDLDVVMELSALGGIIDIPEAEEWVEIIESIKEDIPVDVINKYRDFSHTYQMCNWINSINPSKEELSSNIEDELSELHVVEDNFESIIEFIKTSIDFKTHKEIKLFLKYIDSYSYAKEVENYFIKEIIDAVKKNIEGTFSLRKILNYFDGTIVFNEIENNKIYDDLRKELLNKNEILSMCIERMFLGISEDEKNILLRNRVANRGEFYFNQKFVTNKKFIYDFGNLSLLKYHVDMVKSGDKIREFLMYLQYALNETEEREFYKYSVINIPDIYEVAAEKKYFILIRLLCLLTGAKNGFNAISISSIEKIEEEQRHKLVYKLKPVKTKYAVIIGDTKERAITIDKVEQYDNRLNECKDILKDKIKYSYYYGYSVDTITPEMWFQEQMGHKFWLLELDIHYRYAWRTDTYFYSINSKELTDLEEIKKYAKDRIPDIYKPYKNRYTVTLYKSETDRIKWRFEEQLAPRYNHNWRKWHTYI